MIPIEDNTFCSRFERGMKPRSKFEELRHELKMTQDVLAEKLGISKELVRRYESLKGFPTATTWKKMKKYAEMNGIELNEAIANEWFESKSSKMRNIYGS